MPVALPYLVSDILDVPVFYFCSFRTLHFLIINKFFSIAKLICVEYIYFFSNEIYSV